MVIGAVNVVRLGSARGALRMLMLPIKVLKVTFRPMKLLICSHHLYHSGTHSERSCVGLYKISLR